MEVKKVLVVGAGTMGHQIAIQTALHGFDVRCYDVSRDMLDKAEAFAKDWVQGRVKKQKLTQAEADALQSGLKFVSDLPNAAADVDLALEAVPDVVEIKKSILAELDAYTPAHTIFASNSSYIVSSRFADAVKDPSKVINMHFFNPALVMKVVEVVKGPHVSEDTFESAMTFVRAIGKQAVPIEKEVYGFLVNRIWTAISMEAGWIVDQGIATVEDVDIAVKGALGHPMGPFEVIDLAGIDLEHSVRMEKFRDTGNKADLPPAILTTYVARGEYGRKTKKGFYTYE
jgi:3-hydroxybutyryl-CoA dehydrogenase